jgi:hypothetical protein
MVLDQTQISNVTDCRKQTNEVEDDRRDGSVSMLSGARDVLESAIPKITCDLIDGVRPAYLTHTAGRNRRDLSDQRQITLLRRRAKGDIERSSYLILHPKPFGATRAPRGMGGDNEGKRSGCGSLRIERPAPSSAKSRRSLNPPNRVHVKNEAMPSFCRKLTFHRCLMEDAF